MLFAQLLKSAARRAVFVGLCLIPCHAFAPDNYYPYIPLNPEQTFLRDSIESYRNRAQLVRVPGCSMAYVNWPLLYRDYPELRRLPPKRVRQMLAETFGVISVDQLSLMGLRTTSVAGLNANQLVDGTYRPEGYDRAHFQFANIPVEGTGGVRMAVDIKGSGISPAGLSADGIEHAKEFLRTRYRVLISEIDTLEQQLRDLERNPEFNQQRINEIKEELAHNNGRLKGFEPFIRPAVIQQEWGNLIQADLTAAQQINDPAQRDAAIARTNREFTRLRQMGHSSGVGTLGEMVNEAILAEAVGLHLANHNNRVREGGPHFGVVGVYGVIAFPRELGVYTGEGLNRDPMGLVLRQAHLGRRVNNTVMPDQVLARDWYGYNQTSHVGATYYSDPNRRADYWEIMRLDFGGQIINDPRYQHDFGMRDGRSIPAEHPQDPNAVDRARYKTEFDAQGTKVWGWSHEAADAFIRGHLNAIETHVENMLRDHRRDFGRMESQQVYNPKALVRHQLWRDAPNPDANSVDVARAFESYVKNLNPSAAQEMRDDGGAKLEIRRFLEALSNRILCKHIPAVFVNADYVNMFTRIKFYREFAETLGQYEAEKAIGANLYELSTNPNVRNLALTMLERAASSPVRAWSESTTRLFEQQITRIILRGNETDRIRALEIAGTANVRSPIVYEALADTVLSQTSSHRNRLNASINLISMFRGTERPEFSSSVERALTEIATNPNLLRDSPLMVREAFRAEAQQILNNFAASGRRLTAIPCEWVGGVTLPRIFAAR